MYMADSVGWTETDTSDFDAGEETSNESFKDDDLIAELEENNVKFTKEDIMFITKDRTGQTIWLEKGNESTGMQHVIFRHADDFQTKHGVGKAEIVSHLETVFQHGKIEYSRVARENGGYERLYSYKGEYYLLTGIGENGYIISAYPIREKEAQKRIMRYGR